MLRKLTATLLLVSTGFSVAVAEGKIDFETVNQVLSNITAEVVTEDGFYKAISFKFDETRDLINNDEVGATLNVGVAKSVWSPAPSSLETQLTLLAKKNITDDELKDLFLKGKAGLETDTLALLRYSTLFTDEFCSSRYGNKGYYNNAMSAFCDKLTSLSGTENFSAAIDTIFNAVEVLREDVDGGIARATAELEKADGEEKARLEQELSQLKDLKGNLGRIVVTKSSGGLLATIEFGEVKFFGITQLYLVVALTPELLGLQADIEITTDAQAYEGFKEKVVSSLGLLAVNNKDTRDQYKGIIKNYADWVRQIVKGEE